MSSKCPCGLSEPYERCCGRFHKGEGCAPTAEALMRSRYSAFNVGDSDYLLRTWHPVTRPVDAGADRRTRWTGLEVLETAKGGPFDTEGTVRFRAHYVERGRRGQLEENSRFVRHGGDWVYVGPVQAPPS